MPLGFFGGRGGGGGGRKGSGGLKVGTPRAGFFGGHVGVFWAIRLSVLGRIDSRRPYVLTQRPQIVIYLRRYVLRDGTAPAKYGISNTGVLRSR